MDDTDTEEYNPEHTDPPQASPSAVHDVRKLYNRIEELETKLAARDAEVQIAFEEAANTVQLERDSFAETEENFQNEIHSLEDTIEELKARLNEVESLERSAFEDGLAAGNRTQSEAQIEIEALTMQLEEAKNEIKSLKIAKHTYMHQNVDETAQEIVQAEVAKQNELSSKVEELTAELNKSQTNLQAYEEMIVAEREKSAEELELQLADQKKMYEDAYKASMKDAVEQFKAEKEKLEARAREACEEEVRKLLDSIEAEKARNEERMIREEEQGIYIKSLEEQLHECRVQLSNLELVSNEVSSLQNRLHSLTEDNCLFEEKCKNLESKLASANEKIAIMEAERSENIQEQGSIQEEVERLKSIFENQNNEVSSLQQSINEKELIIQERDDQILTLQMQLEDLRSQVNALTTEKDESISSKELSDNKVKELNTLVEKQLSDANKMQTELDLAKNENEILKSKAEDIESVIEKQKNDIDILQNDLDGKDQEIKEYKETVEQLKEEINSLKSARVSRLSTPPTRSIPTPKSQSSVSSPSPRPRKSAVTPLSKNSIGVATPRESSRLSRSAARTMSTSKKSTSPRTQPTKLSKKQTLYGTTSFGTRVDAPNTEVRVMFCVKHADLHKQIVLKLGGIVLEDIVDAPSATHIIAGDKNLPLRRTPKLMIGLNSTANVLHMDWVISSKRQGRFCETRPYLLLLDRTAESNYSFSMKETLLNGEMRRSEGGLLKGWSLYFAKNVAGNKAPKEDELNLMVTSAGGCVLECLNSEADLSNVIVITSDSTTLPDLVEAQLAEEYVSQAAEIFSTSWLYNVIIHQKLSGLKRGRK